jgi:3-hydroxy acid dehydrogenase/malonic semialdehyde reductase
MPDIFDLQGKIALVTGASSGIGKALSKEIVKRGGIVIGISRSQNSLVELEQCLGHRFIPMVCDVTSHESVENAFLNLTEKEIFPDLFFLNASIAGEEALENQGFEIAKHLNIMQTNYFGVLHFVHHWHKNSQKPVHFIVTSSVNALWTPPSGSAYAASKAAISKAFEGLSLTFAKSESKFSSLYCGPVQTKGLKGKLPFTWSPEKMAKYMADFSADKKSRKYPSLFYYITCNVLKLLPYRLVSKLFT